MKRGVWSLVLGALAFYSCSPAATPVPIPTNTFANTPTLTPSPVPLPTPTPMPAYPDLAIMMYMSGGCCLGPREYSLTVDASGNVGYEELHWGALRVKRSAKITPRQIDDLVAAIEKADVFALGERYGAHAPTDQGTMDIFITLNGRTKRISHYPALICSGYYEGSTMPGALCELEFKLMAAGNLDSRFRPVGIPRPR